MRRLANIAVIVEAVEALSSPLIASQVHRMCESAAAGQIACVLSATPPQPAEPCLVQFDADRTGVN
jgi:hypothetical protein